MKRNLLVVAGAFAALALFSHAADDARRPFGITQRQPWTTSRIQGSLEPPLPYKTERIFPKLEFDRPTDFATDGKRLYVMELQGKIFSFPADPKVARADLFGDLQRDVEGFYRAYGIEFPPDYARSKICYLCYVLKDQPDGSRVSRFRVIEDQGTPRIDPKSETILLTWKSGGHNGGCLKFGPDGYLYISTGDGGPAFPPDPSRTGQDISDLTASILRIDVNQPAKGKHYSIPADNPFVKLKDARGEVWAFGLRNPWKMSFDPRTGDLWVGDVGWEMWEMIYRIERGGNYGWSLVEAAQPVHQEGKRGPTPILPPTVAHSHTESRSITGGYVYRGKRLPELAGSYIYGDYVTGIIWAVRFDGKKITSKKTLVDTQLQIICFGVDTDGELIIVGYDGTFHRLVRNPTAAANQNFPKKLSETGLFASVKGHKLAAGVLPYSIRMDPWMDGAVAERFLAVPGMGKLGVHKATDVWLGKIKGEWEFPPDTVIGKTIALDLEAGNPKSRRRLETQILHLDDDTWRAYTYVWNDAQTDAVLAPSEGMDRPFVVRDADAPGGKRTQVWHFPSRSECIQCHTTRAGSIHALTAAQLNRDHRYGDVVDNQLRTLDHIGLFAEPLPESRPMFPALDDDQQTLEAKARAYLHVNCAHCHRRGGGGTAAIDIQFQFPLKKTNMLGSRPTQGTFEIPAAQVVAAGDPYRSLLYYRMAKSGSGHMPHFGSNVIDARGLKLMHDWILSLPVQKEDAVIAKQRAHQQDTLRTLTKTTDPAKALQQAEQLLANTSGALVLLKAFDAAQLDAGVRQQILAHVSTKTPAHIRDLFERFLPEDQRVKRLGTNINVSEILSRKGDAGRGKQLFFTSASMQCRNCHRIAGMGVELGPDLSTIGKKYNRAQLLESMLLPSKNIEPKYVTYLIETSRGQVHSGLLVRRDAKEVVLKTPENKEVHIPTSEVELMTPQQRSIMPDQMLRDMTAEELADLLAYLSSLR